LSTTGKCVISWTVYNGERLCVAVGSKGGSENDRIWKTRWFIAASLRLFVSSQRMTWHKRRRFPVTLTRSDKCLRQCASTAAPGFNHHSCCTLNLWLNPPSYSSASMFSLGNCDCRRPALKSRIKYYWIFSS